jgi:ribosomal protein S18 acetylase RimI-like enzyme
MLGRDERRRAEIAAGQTHSGPRTLMSFIDDPDTGAVSLLTGRGYHKARTYFHMVRPDMEDIVVPPLPDGLEVRPITPDLLPRLWAAMAEAFADHFGGQDFSDPAFRRWSGDSDLDLSLLTVAFEGDEIAAGVQGQIVAEENALHGYLRGWTDPIFTRRAWRRRGLAAALIGRCLTELRDRGMTSAQLGVDSQNPNQALTLYERHGFRVVTSSSEWHRPLDT